MGWRVGRPGGRGDVGGGRGGGERRRQVGGGGAELGGVRDEGRGRGGVWGGCGG